MSPFDIGQESRLAASAGVETARHRSTLRILFIVAVAMSAVAGFVATSSAAAQLAADQAGPDLTRLTWFMAGTKALVALGLMGGVFWRLGRPIKVPILAAYLVSCIAMATGIGLICCLAHASTGATLTVGGIIATVFLLWRDQAVGAGLEDLLRRKTGGTRRD